jgi:hypothetical protein
MMGVLTRVAVGAADGHAARACAGSLHGHP